MTKKKSTVGIFGDSFAERMIPEELFAKRILNGVDYKKVLPDIIDRSYSYHDYINDNGYEYTTYGVGGSDIYYSYLKFLENHEKYDKIIFFVTNFNRVSFNKNNEWIHTGVNENDQFKKDIWFLDSNRTALFCKLLLNSIKEKRPDAIFINVFYNPLMFFGLFKIYEYETHELVGNKLGSGSWLGDNYLDMRICHMTKPSHVILGQKIVDALDNNKTFIKINVDDFKRKFDNREKDYYILQGNYNLKNINLNYFLNRNDMKDLLV